MKFDFLGLAIMFIREPETAGVFIGCCLGFALLTRLLITCVGTYGWCASLGLFGSICAICFEGDNAQDHATFVVFCAILLMLNGGWYLNKMQKAMEDATKKPAV